VQTTKVGEVSDIVATQIGLMGGLGLLANCVSCKILGI